MPDSPRSDRARQAEWAASIKLDSLSATGAAARASLATKLRHALRDLDHDDPTASRIRGLISELEAE